MPLIIKDIAERGGAARCHTMAEGKKSGVLNPSDGKPHRHY